MLKPRTATSQTREGQTPVIVQQAKTPVLKRSPNLLRIPSTCTHNIHDSVKSNVFNNMSNNNAQNNSSSSISSYCSRTMNRWPQSEHGFTEILSPPHRRSRTRTDNTKTERNHYSYEELSKVYSKLSYPQLVEGKSIKTDTAASIDNIIYSENLKAFLYPQLIRTVKLPVPGSTLKKSKSVRIIDNDPLTDYAADGLKSKNNYSRGNKETFHPNPLLNIRENQLTNLETLCKQPLPLPPKSPRSLNTIENNKNAKLGCIHVRDSLTLIKSSVGRIQLKTTNAKGDENMTTRRCNSKLTRRFPSATGGTLHLHPTVHTQ